MRLNLLTKSNIYYGSSRMCEQFCLFTSEHSIDEIKRLQNEGRKIVCFGAGKNSWMYINVLRESGIEPDIITDNRIKSPDVFLDDKPIIPPIDLLKNKEQYYFIITIEDFTFVNQIKKQLLLNGVKDLAVLSLERILDFDRSEYKDLESAFLKAFNEIYSNIDFYKIPLIKKEYTLPIAKSAHTVEWILKKYTDGKETSDISLLDVGPGIGLASMLYKQLLNVSLNWIVLEETPQKYMLSQHPKFIKDNDINIQRGYIETDDFQGEYDIILLTQVIEHFVYNPISTLNKLKKMMKPNAYLVVSTPMKRNTSPKFFESWRDLPIVNEETAKLNSEFMCISEQNHVYEYSMEEIEELFNEVGLKIVYKNTSDLLTVTDMIYILSKDI